MQNRPLAASKKVMQNYMSELLTEEPSLKKQTPVKNIEPMNAQVEKDKHLEKLLQNIEIVKKVEQPLVESPPLSRINTKELSKTVESIAQPLKVSSNKIKTYRESSFQALFFKVAGLTLAIPLTELGGIYQMDKITPLIGKPDWFKGVMLYRDEKVNVVDTALWVMPEKCNDSLKNSLNYKYIIMLSNSPWGLSAEQLVNTKVLEQDEVKWLDSSDKRPWLAGLVKDRMCALLDAESLVQLLNDGVEINLALNENIDE